MKLILEKIKKSQPKRFAKDYKSTLFRSPKKKLLEFIPTNTEMTGPLFDEKIIDKNANDLTLNFSQNGGKALGQEIFVYGIVKDEFGKPQSNVLIEIWQANSGGKYRHQSDNNDVSLDPNFAGCGRFLTSKDGRYHFKTIQPGAYLYPNRGIEWRPMHIHFSLFGRSFAQRLVTQMYFEGDPLIATCPMINSIPDKKSRKLLISKLDFSKTESHKILAYNFDLVLRGINQTYFERN